MPSALCRILRPELGNQILAQKSVAQRQGLEMKNVSLAQPATQVGRLRGHPSVLDVHRVAA